MFVLSTAGCAASVHIMMAWG